MGIRTVQATNEQKEKFFTTLCLHLPLNLDDKLTLNYIKRYKNNTKNGNSLYIYNFYGIDKECGTISDLTWQVANIVGARYNFDNGFIVGYNNKIHDIITDLNEVRKNTDFKEIVAKEVL